MKKKNIFIVLAIILIIGVTIFFIFFDTKMAKNLKVGNNISSQEIVECILNISSYEATIEVEVSSNKDKNRYVLRQRYEDSSVSEQEVLEPSNIAGVKMIRNGNQLTIENTNLSLSSIFENYECVSDNSLDLSCFIEDYKKDEKSNWKEKEHQIIMKAVKGQEEKKLFIDRETGKPTRLEINRANKKTKVYISYKEVNFHN